MPSPGPYAETRVAGTLMAVQLLGPDAAVVVTRGGVQQQGETEVAPARTIRAMRVVVDRDGDWRLVAYHNSPEQVA